MRMDGLNSGVCGEDAGQTWFSCFWSTSGETESMWQHTFQQTMPLLSLTTHNFLFWLFYILTRGLNYHCQPKLFVVFFMWFSSPDNVSLSISQSFSLFSDFQRTIILVHRWSQNSFTIILTSILKTRMFSSKYKNQIVTY